MPAGTAPPVRRRTGSPPGAGRPRQPGTVDGMAPFTPPAADAVRTRLLLAARDEFAAVGLAGARVERLAAAADSNKAQVFHYFGGKEGLFDAVVEHEYGALLDAVPIDTDDVPAWAGRLHDAALERPWLPRLLAWRRLERGAAAPLPVLADGYRDMAEAVERAQRTGALPRTMRAPVLLGLVLQLTGTWQGTAPEYEALVAAVTPARRRQTVVDAVTALLAGSTRSSR